MMCVSPRLQLGIQTASFDVGITRSSGTDAEVRMAVDACFRRSRRTNWQGWLSDTEWLADNAAPIGWTPGNGAASSTKEAHESTG